MYIRFQEMFGSFARRCFRTRNGYGRTAGRGTVGIPTEVVEPCITRYFLFCVRSDFLLVERLVVRMIPAMIMTVGRAIVLRRRGLYVSCGYV